MENKPQDSHSRNKKDFIRALEGVSQGPETNEGEDLHVATLNTIVAAFPTVRKLTRQD